MGVRGILITNYAKMIQRTGGNFLSISHHTPLHVPFFLSYSSLSSTQVLHFFIGLGALVSPLVADPFLSEGSCVLGGNLTANSSTDLHHLRSSLAGKGTTPLHNVSHHYHLHTQGIIITTNISYAFWIMSFY